MSTHVMKIRSMAGALLGAFALAGSAQAGLLGNTLGADPNFSTIGNLCCGGPFSAVVGAGVEFAPGSFPDYNRNAYVDASDTSIEYGQTDGTIYADATFNGFHYYDALNAIDAILGVSINPATNLAGFDMSRVSFDANNVYINMQGLSAGTAHRVVIDLRFDAVTAVPAPASLALAGLGLLMLGASAKRRPV